MPDLLDQIDGPVERYTTDGAYDGSPTRDLLVTRLGEIVVVIIPSPKMAVASSLTGQAESARDRHIAEIATKDCMVWQESTGCNQRSRVETQMGLWTTVIGRKFKARNFDNQKTEAKTGVRVLIWMTDLGRLAFGRIA